MESTVDNTAMQMIETTYMNTQNKKERMKERILLIPTETNETPIQAPITPVNEEGDNEEQYVETEKLRHPIEVLDVKVKKPQFRYWYVKEVFGTKIYPCTKSRIDL